MVVVPCVAGDRDQLWAFSADGRATQASTGRHLAVPQCTPAPQKGPGIRLVVSNATATASACDGRDQRFAFNANGTITSAIDGACLNIYEGENSGRGPVQTWKGCTDQGNKKGLSARRLAHLHVAAHTCLVGRLPCAFARCRTYLLACPFTWARSTATSVMVVPAGVFRSMTPLFPFCALNIDPNSLWERNAAGQVLTKARPGYDNCLSTGSIPAPPAPPAPSPPPAPEQVGLFFVLFVVLRPRDWSPFFLKLCKICIRDVFWSQHLGRWCQNTSRTQNKEVYATLYLFLQYAGHCAMWRTLLYSGYLQPPQLRETVNTQHAWCCLCGHVQRSCLCGHARSCLCGHVHTTVLCVHNRRNSRGWGHSPLAGLRCSS